MIFRLIFTIFVLIISIIFHEFGHYIAIKIFKLKAIFFWESDNRAFMKPIKKSIPFLNKIKDPTFKVYGGATKRQRILLFMSGILFGLIPIFIYIYVFNVFIFNKIILFFGYFIGCFYDIQGVLILMGKKTKGG